jgi:hypothetical protein
MNQSMPKETPCPDCGEMVRVNSLRCWNCGAFMNSEVEQKYMAMQANPREAIFSDLPAEDSQPTDAEASDDDFQLKIPVPRPISGPVDEQPIRIVQEEESAPAADETSQGDESSPADTAPQAEAAADENSSESAPRAGRPSRPTSDQGGVAHSVATAGDALLDIAIQEEREVKKKQKGRKLVGGMKTPGGGLIIFCPYGCRIEVRETHRGMTGRCPRCAAPFIVPIDPPRFKESRVPAAEAGSPEGNAGGLEVSFGVWLKDLHLHTVDPAKLKLKADSLAKDFTEVDFGLSPDALLVANLTKKASGGGLFAKGSGEKKETVRENMLAWLAEKKPLAELPVGEKFLFDAVDAPQIKVVQPAPNRADSIFHGVPVFGTHRVAIQLPLNESTLHPLYLSMGVSDFWKLTAALQDLYGIPDLDAGSEVPREARTALYKCHYMNTPIKALQDIEYLKADPNLQLEVAGYQCGACKIAVSEAGRKKENLGGKSPKGIAKAKCPKCGQKMGEHLLYSLKSDVVEPELTSST